MSKKNKKRWVTNSPNENPSTDIIFSDDALDELIMKEFGSKMNEAKRFGPTNKQPITLGSDQVTMPMREKNPVENLVSVPRMYTQQAPQLERRREPEQRFSKIRGVLETNGFSEDDLVSIVNEYLTKDTQEESTEKPDTAVNATGVVIDDIVPKRTACVKNINGVNFLVMTDKSGNRLTIPVANESTSDYSIRYLIQRFEESVANSSPVVTDEYLKRILHDDFPSMLAKSQILWGKPDFVIEVEDIDDELSDLHVKEYCGVNLLLTKSSGNPGYIYGYIINDITDLMKDWADIIDAYFTSKDDYESFDELLLSCMTACRMLSDTRYISYGELGSSFTEYLIDNSDYSDTTDIIKEAFLTIAKPLPEFPELSIKIDKTVDNIAIDIDNIFYEISNEVLALFYTTESDSEEGYDEDSSEDTEDAEYSELSSDLFDPEEMARQFAEEYQKTHPDVQTSGYVQNVESVGAPVGEEPFHEQRRTGDPQSTDSEKVEADPAASIYGGSSDGTTGTSSSKSTSPVVESNSNGDGRDASTDRPWKPDVSDYTKTEVKEEKIEEKETTDGSGNYDGVQTVQKEVSKGVQKIASDKEDDLIIPVV